MSKRTTFEPVVQWAGGKAQLLDTLVPMLPDTFGAYHEPFFGGGALFLELSATGRLEGHRTYVNDLNTRLMNLYHVVQKKTESLISVLRVLDHFKDQDSYTAIRTLFNSGKRNDGVPFSDVQCAALFMYINRMCFNGLFRVNSKGEFNVQYRKDPNRDIVRKDALLAASKYLRDTTLLSMSFGSALRYVLPGDLVFADPPYVPISETAKHTSYIGEFGEAEQLSLMTELRRLSRMGSTS